MSPEEKYVFYGVAGKGVNEMSDFDMFIRDTPAIVSYALGLKGTEGWDSYVPENLFVEGDALLKRPPSAPNLVYPNTTPEESNEKYITLSILLNKGKDSNNNIVLFYKLSKIVPLKLNDLYLEVVSNKLKKASNRSHPFSKEPNHCLTTFSGYTSK